MSRTPDQQAADAQLNAAIEQIAGTDEELPAGYMVMEWVVAYVAQNPDDEDRTIYGSAFPNGSAPSHRSIGLLDITRHRLLTSGWDEDT